MEHAQVEREHRDDERDETDPEAGTAYRALVHRESPSSCVRWLGNGWAGQRRPALAKPSCEPTACEPRASSVRRRIRSSVAGWVENSCITRPLPVSGLTMNMLAVAGCGCSLGITSAPRSSFRSALA